MKDKIQKLFEKIIKLTDLATHFEEKATLVLQFLSDNSYLHSYTKESAFIIYKIIYNNIEIAIYIDNHELYGYQVYFNYKYEVLTENTYILSGEYRFITLYPV